jgi:hypothetical protein
VSAEWDYPDDLALLREQAPSLAGEFAAFTGIRSVLDWMQERGLTKAGIDIVGQDEFHYDFLIELEPAGRWVSFGVT